MKKNALIIIIIGLFLSLSYFSIIKSTFDKRNDFTNSLISISSSIKKNDWDNSLNELETTTKKWNKMKPFLQINLDHDYVNAIDIELKKLQAYIETNEQPASLASIYEIIEFWDYLGQR